MVNTGWTGGPYGIGERIKLKYTRAMINAALNGEIENQEFVHNKFFNVDVPQGCPDVPAEMLNPSNTWNNKESYDTYAEKLVKMFNDNFASKYPNISEDIVNAGPRIIE